jgi:hypothetical protein
MALYIDWCDKKDEEHHHDDLDEREYKPYER